jgi:superfamily II DNA or RNA helicase
MMPSLEELLSKPNMSQYLLAEWYKRCPDQNPRLIRIVSAKAGAGKTLGLTKDISENPQKSLIVCQTIALLDQTKTTLTEYAGIPPRTHPLIPLIPLIPL